MYTTEVYVLKIYTGKIILMPIYVAFQLSYPFLIYYYYYIITKLPLTCMLKEDC